MGVRIVLTQAAQELLVSEVALLRAAAQRGPATLLVGSAAEKRRVQRQLARAGVGLGLAVLTPVQWLADRWALFGDGRALASAVQRRLLMTQVLGAATDEERGPLGNNAGTAKLLARMASELLPQATVCVGEKGAQPAASADAQACAALLLARYQEELARRILVEPCEAAAMLAGGRAVFSGAVIVRGVDDLPAYLLDLLRAQAASADLAFLLNAQEASAAQELAQAFMPLTAAVERWNEKPAEPGALHAGLDGLFSHCLAAGGGAGGGEALRSVPGLMFAEISGPTVALRAEAELIARAARAGGGLGEGSSANDAPATSGLAAPAPSVLVVSPRPGQAFLDLAPWLAARGMAVEGTLRARFEETRAGAQFFALLDLAQRMASGPAGTWWPAPELSDWLLSPFSGCGKKAARAFDKRIRGNRQLDADQVMSELQRIQTAERKARRQHVAKAGLAPQAPRGRAGLSPTDPLPPDDGVACFDVPDALRRGKVLEALRRLAGAAQALSSFALGDGGSAPVLFEQRATQQALAFFYEATAHLRVTPQAALQALRELSVSLDVTAAPESAAACEGPVASAGLAAPGEPNVRETPCPGAPEPAASAGPLRVRITSLAQASAEPSASAGAVVALDVDVESYPLSQREDAATSLAAALGRTALRLAPAARLRRQFHRALRAGRTGALLARVTHDGAADERYPAALWTEIASVAQVPCAQGLPGEELFAENLEPAGPAATQERAQPAAYALDSAALPYLVLTRADGEGNMVPRRLSASQIEGYLSCPYQWFLTSRVRPAELDARFGPLETGNFVHDVMQVFHEELTEAPAGRVTPENVEDELQHLRRVFDVVRARHAAGKTSTSAALIALTPSEELEFEEVWHQLSRSVRAEAALLPGFKPAYAEFSFDQLNVTYAGWPLGGRIDRIDVDGAGRAVVIDYKHRGLAEFRLSDPTARLEAGEKLDPAWLPAHVQTLIYAQAVRRAFAGELEVVGALYFGTKSGAFAGAVSAAYAEEGLVPGMRSGFPGAKGGALSFTGLLDHVEGAVAARLDALARGAIAPALHPMNCRFCPAVACERRV